MFNRYDLFQIWNKLILFNQYVFGFIWYIEFQWKSIWIKFEDFTLFVWKLWQLLIFLMWWKPNRVLNIFYRLIIFEIDKELWEFLVFVLEVTVQQIMRKYCWHEYVLHLIWFLSFNNMCIQLLRRLMHFGCVGKTSLDTIGKEEIHAKVHFVSAKLICLQIICYFIIWLIFNEFLEYSFDIYVFMPFWLAYFINMLSVEYIIIT